MATEQAVDGIVLILGVGKIEIPHFASSVLLFEDGMSAAIPAEGDMSPPQLFGKTPEAQVISSACVKVSDNVKRVPAGIEVFF